jgi:hypothetical protein
VLVLVSGYSRMITAVMLPSRQGADLLAEHWQLIAGWGRVPRALVWDNESAVGSWAAAVDGGDERLPRNAGDQGDPVPAG